MKFPKGLVFLTEVDRLTIKVSERELIMCDDCKYLACTLNGQRWYCTQHEHTVKPNEWCSRAEKSKHSRTGDFEAQEYKLTGETNLSNVMRESMRAISGYYEEFEQ